MPGSYLLHPLGWLGPGQPGGAAWGDGGGGRDLGQGDSKVGSEPVTPGVVPGRLHPPALVWG